jgi:hypothetical protein
VLTGLIPGFRVSRSELYIGFWHLINVRDTGLFNSYDDHQGMYLPQAGPAGVPGIVDTAIITGSSLVGVTLDPARSAGVERYMISSSADGHQATKMRKNYEWNKESIGTTQFSPLDNLAYGGFMKYRTEPVKKLGWPLHAIGDATVPMHVVATTSWGHSVYELWVEQHWDELVFEACKENDAACNDATLRQNQLAQAQRVLQIAYRWRQYLLTHGIRDYITALGKDTLAKVGDTPSSWPWCDQCSAYSDADLKNLVSDFAAGVPNIPVPGGSMTPVEIARDPLKYYDYQWDNIRQLVESAMGAKLAFLVWASQGEYPQCIGHNAFGCIPNGVRGGLATSTDCCDPNDFCLSNQCGIPN